MATNVFFQNYNNVYEQNLIDDLVIESIQIYGIDVNYITRSRQGEDNILNEDDMPLYDEMFGFEVYVKNVDGFEGEGDFLSKFGLEIRDQITFTVAIRTFERFVTREDQNKVRPLEGDIIWMPLNEKLYEIKYVEHESVFYQSGALQVYDMRCELIEASGQRFDTGHSQIDNYFVNNNIPDSKQLIAAVVILVGIAITTFGKPAPVAQVVEEKRETSSKADLLMQGDNVVSPSV